MKMYKQQRLLRVLANGAGDSARRRRVGRRARTRRRRTPAAATWENRRKCPVAAKYNYNGCGRPDRWAEGRRGQTGREGGRACSRAATEVARKTQRNDGQAWHSVERGRERDHAPLDIVGKKKFPPPAASPPPLFPSASVRYHSVLSFGVGVGRHRKRRRSRLICPNGLCLRQREQDHKTSETAQEGESGS